MTATDPYVPSPRPAAGSGFIILCYPVDSHLPVEEERVDGLGRGIIQAANKAWLHRKYQHVTVSDDNGSVWASFTALWMARL